MFLRYNSFTIAWAMVILGLVLLPGDYMPESNYWDLFKFDKFAHMMVFAILSFLMIIGFVKQYTYRILKEEAVKYALVISVSYGIILEVLQHFIPNRTVELYDIIANTMGCFIGYGLFYLVYKWKGLGLK
jgi:VanZ family protein